MNAEAVRACDTIALVSDLDSHLDPVELYAALSDHGARPETMLFEQASGPAFILDAAAVRIECRGLDVVLTALTSNGRELLRLLSVRMAGHVIDADPDQIQLRFERITSPDSDERLKLPSPFDVLRALTTGLKQAGSREPFGVLLLGIVAFDHVDMFETLPAPAADPLGFPDLLFWVAESVILFEKGRTPRAISTAFADDGDAGAAQAAKSRLLDLVDRCRQPAPLRKRTEKCGRKTEFKVDVDDAEFANLVDRLKTHIATGDAYQIVVSRSFSAPCPDPFGKFQMLRKRDPSPYSFFVRAPSFSLFGASPETSVRVFDDDGLNVELKPIAGTRRRGSSEDEDDRLEAELRLDPKELAEHMMLVDLARNDVARISKSGTRHVSQMMAVERYARVMHLVSRVTGKLRENLDALDALKACLNMGTLSGTPKIRATALLRQAERTKRGPYGGAIGWLNGEGLMDSAIVIRSAIVKDGVAHVRAGAGIVHDSDPCAEADETRRKAEALISVLTGRSE